MFQTTNQFMSGFPKSGVLQNGWFVKGNHKKSPNLKWMIQRYPHFRKPPCGLQSHFPTNSLGRIMSCTLPNVLNHPHKGCSGANFSHSTINPTATDSTVHSYLMLSFSVHQLTIVFLIYDYHIISQYFRASDSTYLSYRFAMTICGDPARHHIARWP